MSSLAASDNALSGLAFAIVFLALGGGLLALADWKHNRNRKRRERGDR